MSGEHAALERLNHKIATRSRDMFCAGERVFNQVGRSRMNVTLIAREVGRSIAEHHIFPTGPLFDPIEDILCYNVASDRDDAIDAADRSDVHTEYRATREFRCHLQPASRGSTKINDRTPASDDAKPRN